MNGTANIKLKKAIMEASETRHGACHSSECVAADGAPPLFLDEPSLRPQCRGRFR